MHMRLDKTLKSVSADLLNLSIDDSLRKLTEIRHWCDPRVVNAVHEQGLVP
jgi:hypothetical protein